MAMPWVSATRLFTANSKLKQVKCTESWKCRSLLPGKREVYLRVNCWLHKQEWWVEWTSSKQPFCSTHSRHTGVAMLCTQLTERACLWNYTTKYKEIQSIIIWLQITTNTVGYDRDSLLLGFGLCSYHQQIHHGELWKNNKNIFEISSSFQIGTVCFFSCTNGAAIFIPCAIVQCIVPTYSCSVIYGVLQGCCNW